MTNKKLTKEYEKMQNELIDYIMSGQMHSTLIGKTISLNNSNSKSDLQEVQEFVEYTISLIKRAEEFRKDNVKKA
jgi:hypothetical protein